MVAISNTTLSGADLGVITVDPVDPVAFLTKGGTAGDDVIYAYTRSISQYDPNYAYTAVHMYGYGGNDELIGGHGDDCIDGGTGNDILCGGYGDDRIDGGTGIDTVDYGHRLSPGYHYYGYGGSTWHPGYGVEVNLEFETARSLDPAIAERDQLFNIENVRGTYWNDVIQGNEGANVLDGYAGDDYIFGWGGADRLLGGDGEDYLSGGDGNDTVTGGLGHDRLHGNAGVDRLDYSYSGSAMLISLMSHVAFRSDGSGLDSDYIFDFETVTGSAFNDMIIGDDLGNTLYGMDGDDALIGNGGNDYLIGGNGNDSFDGGAGGDAMFGGAGTDTADYSASSAGVTISPSYYGIGGDAQWDSLVDIENIIGSEFADVLGGDALNNELSGLGGADVLNGFDGQDYLAGGLGADHINGGNGSDTASYLMSNAAVSINLAAGAAAGGHATGDILTGIENLEGSAFADTLRAGAFAATFNGLQGNDALVGAGLADHLLGGGGNDVISGNGGADWLSGGDGLDRIVGGLGNDIINGGAHADVLTGGTGGDSFVYSWVTDSQAGVLRDRITDFVQGEDTIGLGGIDAILSLPNIDNAFSFIGANAFTPGMIGELRAQVIGANTLIQGETNGWAGADFEILLTGVFTLQAADFVL